MPTRFDDIRHYTDAEMQVALQRLVNCDEFSKVVSYAFPNQPVDAIAHRISQISTVRQLQDTIMVEAMDTVISKSMTSFTHSGFENLRPEKPHLFVSNHRDIVLDAYMLQYLLSLNGMKTTRITFGANLMRNDFLRELGLCNKMFRTERTGTVRHFYESLSHLSDYINSSLLNDGESVWIAQRGGRTKDGLDATDPAVIKMFGMNDSKIPIVETYSRLSIVPLTVSYEFEPCDSRKAVERCKTKNGHYVKAPDEDLESIVSGIVEPKGRVHLSIGKPIETCNLQNLPSGRNEFCETLANLIDNRISAGRQLYANNYIAYDLLNDTTRYVDRYSQMEQSHFIERLQSKIDAVKGDVDEVLFRKYFLQLYANAL